MPMSPMYKRYQSFLQALPVKNRYEQSELLVPELQVDKQQNIEMYYAPHNEYVNPRAKIIIVGITPGWSQMELSIRTLRKALAENKSDEAAVKEAKMAARFAGTMRKNLIQMLDHLNLHTYLNLADSESLFNEKEDLLHTTSLLRYPVFIDKQNYTGHKPALTGSPFLYNMAQHTIASELYNKHNTLIIPLGKTVESVMRKWLDENNQQASTNRCLWGFPHPSGANGHRHVQFDQAREAMEREICAFVSGVK